MQDNDATVANATPSGVVKQIRHRSQQAQRRIIFPEQGDPRVQHAVTEILAEKLCQPVLFEPAPEIHHSCEVFWELPDAGDWFERAVEAYANRMKDKGYGLDDARNQLRDPLLLGTVLVHLGYVDSGVAGSVAATVDILRACLRGIGLASDSHLVSSVFVIDHHHRLMTFGDCAVNPSPDPEQLARIAIDSAATHCTLTGQEARVALLSFSTHGSAEHADVDKVREALAIVRELAPELLVCGELQLDAALVPEVGAAKAADSAVAGNANVLIFPDLNSGNIGYKMAERLGGAHAVGPVLQGLDKPWVDLSRGCSSEDIINAAAIASVLASEKETT